jgi:hypothetical protein
VGTNAKVLVHQRAKSRISRTRFLTHHLRKATTKCLDVHWQRFLLRSRVSSCELSPYQGGKIERSCELGQSIRAIAKETKFAPSTVQNTLNTNPHRNEAVKSSGRPKKYTNETHVKFLNLFELILSLHTQIINKILIFTSGASLMTLSVAFSLPLELRIGEQKEDRH